MIALKKKTCSFTFPFSLDLDESDLKSRPVVLFANRKSGFNDTKSLLIRPHGPAKQEPAPLDLES